MKYLALGLAALSLSAAPAFAQSRPSVAKKAAVPASAPPAKAKRVTVEKKTAGPAKARPAARQDPKARR